MLPLGSPSKPGTNLTFRPRKLAVRFPFPAICVSNLTLYAYIYEKGSTQKEVTSLSQVTGSEIRRQSSYFYFYLYLTITLSLMHSDAYNARIIGQIYQVLCFLGFSVGWEKFGMGKVELKFGTKLAFDLLSCTPLVMSVCLYVCMLCQHNSKTTGWIFKI